MYYPDFFSNLAQLTAMYNKLKICSKKMGSPWLFFASCARNVQSWNNRQKVLSYNKNYEYY